MTLFSQPLFVLSAGITGMHDHIIIAAMATAIASLSSFAAAAAAADNDDAMELFVQKTHVARGAVNFHSSFCLE